MWELKQARSYCSSGWNQTSILQWHLQNFARNWWKNLTGHQLLPPVQTCILVVQHRLTALIFLVVKMASSGRSGRSRHQECNLQKRKSTVIKAIGCYMVIKSLIIFRQWNILLNLYSAWHFLTFNIAICTSITHQRTTRLDDVCCLVQRLHWMLNGGGKSHKTKCWVTVLFLPSFMSSWRKATQQFVQHSKTISNKYMVSL